MKAPIRYTYHADTGEVRMSMKMLLQMLETIRELTKAELTPKESLR